MEGFLDRQGRQSKTQAFGTLPLYSFARKGRVPVTVQTSGRTVPKVTTIWSPFLARSTIRVQGPPGISARDRHSSSLSTAAAASSEMVSQ